MFWSVPTSQAATVDDAPPRHIAALGMIAFSQAEPQTFTFHTANLFVTGYQQPSMSTPNIALPGQILGPTSVNNLGNGTHIHHSHLIASLAGPLTSHPSTTKSTKLPTVSIPRHLGPLLPEVGTLVLGKITRTTARQAHLSILALGATGEHPVGDPFPAVIRQQDIRATEIDKVKVEESFRVGDVVRAVVISLGDERSYYCSTARNELGVVMARGEGGLGEQMVPVSWQEFMDPVTGVRERRKVAKPV